MKKTIVVATQLVETSPQALPLGAACIVSALKSDSEIEKSFNIILKDFSAEDSQNFDLATQKITEQIAETKPDIVAFSVFVWNRKVLTECATQLRKIFPKIILIAGGPEVTANPQSFSNTFDYTISGQGEQKVCALVRQIANIPANAQPMSAANISPYLDGTLDPAKYDGALWELARGCPFNCSYCYESKGDKKVTHFPLERLKAELNFFKQKKITQIFVLDPTYNADKKRALEMLDYIIKTAPEIFFHFEVRSEFIDLTMAKKFSQIQCSLQIGIQSAHEEVLKNVNRSFNRKDFTKKIALLNNVGAVFGFDLIYGLPGDTLNLFKESIDYAISLYPNHLELFRLSVLPGTDLFDIAKNFELNFMSEPPYHILSSKTYSTNDIAIAQKISNACSLFYTQGRAVSWFNSILHVLKMRASKFFELFSDFYNSTNNCILTHHQIEKIQLEFIQKLFTEHKLNSIFALATDVIILNGALSRAYADAENSTVTLHYNPDDILSPYSQDLFQFAKAVKQKHTVVKVFNTKNGANYKY